MFASLFNFTCSDEVANFFSDCRVRNIKFAHDVFVKNGVVVVVLNVSENSGSVNVSESQIKRSFHFYLVFIPLREFYNLLKYLSKK